MDAAAVIADIALSPDGRTAYVAGCDSFCVTGSVEVLDTRAGRSAAAPYRSAGEDGSRVHDQPGRPECVGSRHAIQSAIATSASALERTGLAVSRDGSSIYVTSRDQRQRRGHRREATTTADAGIAASCRRPRGTGSRGHTRRPTGVRVYRAGRSGPRRALVRLTRRSGVWTMIRRPAAFARGGPAGSQRRASPLRGRSRRGTCRPTSVPAPACR